jgi:hypothetical protein
MIHYTKERIPYDEFITAIKKNKPLEILVMGEHWSDLGKHVYSWDQERLKECWKQNNYRRKPKYKKFQLTKGCLADKPKSLPSGYLW